MFEILIIALVVVHLDLEYRIWIARQKDVFVKYRNETMEPLTAAKWAYYAKAIWLISLILLQYFGVEFRSAVVWSFTAYAVLLQVTLPFRFYNALNLLLALACLLERWLQTRGGG